MVLFSTTKGEQDPWRGFGAPSVAGCVGCQEEGVRQGKGLATVSCLEGSGNAGGRGAGTGNQRADTQPAAETSASLSKAWERREDRIPLPCANLALLPAGRSSGSWHEGQAAWSSRRQGGLS